MKIPSVRPVIAKLTGYVPGEQPKWNRIVKLNTNENPYPPTPRLKHVLTDSAIEKLRLYPDPVAQALREEIAAFHGVSPWRASRMRMQQVSSGEVDQRNGKAVRDWTS